MTQKKKPEVLAIITARGGSKSIPNKSIAPCAGKPLMYYTIKAAQQAKTVTRLIISTDNEEMAAVARKCGVEVPFMRPKHLASDKAQDLGVLEHALSELRKKEGYVPDAVIHLRPTTPLKKAGDIDRGVKLLLSHKEATSVRSICQPLHTPFKMYKLDKKKGLLEPLLMKVFTDVFEKLVEPHNMPRQMLPQVWRHSGYVDIIRPQVITELHSMSGPHIAPLFFEEWRDIDIDSPFEIAMAADVIKKLRKEGREPWE